MKIILKQSVMIFVWYINFKKEICNCWEPKKKKTKQNETKAKVNQMMYSFGKETWAKAMFLSLSLNLNGLSVDANLYMHGSLHAIREGHLFLDDGLCKWHTGSQALRWYILMQLNQKKERKSEKWSTWIRSLLIKTREQTSKHRRNISLWNHKLLFGIKRVTTTIFMQSLYGTKVGSPFQ